MGFADIRSPFSSGMDMLCCVEVTWKIDRISCLVVEKVEKGGGGREREEFYAFYRRLEYDA